MTLFPKVIAEQRTTCDSYIEFYPVGAITMKNSKTFGNTNSYMNCRTCIRICPIKTFIVE